MEITVILERFYLKEVVSKYAKTSLACTENTRQLTYEENTPRLFADRVKTEVEFSAKKKSDPKSPPY